MTITAQQVQTLATLFAQRSAIIEAIGFIESGNEAVLRVKDDADVFQDIPLLGFSAQTADALRAVQQVVEDAILVNGGSVDT